MEILEYINNIIDIVLNYLGIFGPILGCTLIVVESILPFLPLCVFITLNCLSFGNVLGIIISWFCTCIGCYISFAIFDKFLKEKFVRKLRKKEVINKTMKIVEKCSISNIAMIVAVPFTPAFVINIACGLSDMTHKKFITGILIGKFFMVYFWGMIGTTFIQSLKHPVVFIKIIIMMVIACLLSKIVTKRFNIK